MLNVDKVKMEVVGRWAGVLESLGIDLYGGKHGPCPICKEGEDRFRFTDTDGNGTYICSQCEPKSGDGWSLLQRSLNVGFMEAVEMVSNLIGTVEISIPQKPDIEKIKASLNRMWVSAKPITWKDPAGEYLKARGIESLPKAVRFHKGIFESDTKETIPAMIAQVTDIEGKPVTIHRTYLKHGQKAIIPKPKKLMPGTKKLESVAIRLSKPGDGILGIAEGIETALSCSQLFKIPTWSVINSGIMESWEPPEDIKRLVIFGDNDKNFTGQAAAYRLAKRISGNGRVVEVEIPDRVGDFNDVLIFGED